MRTTIESLTVAIVGTAFGCWAHVGAFRRAGWAVKYLVGRNRERTASQAHQFNIPYPVTTFQHVLDDPSVDAVVISTPPETHAHLCGQAFSAGKHVLCEKPMALTLIEARKMAAIAAASGRVHRMGTNFRWSARGAVLRHVLLSGLVGEPIYGLFQREHNLLCDPDSFAPPDWWNSTARGAGWLFNSGSHYLDLIRFAVGEFSELSAAIHSSTDHKTVVEDTYTIQFRLANGLAGVLGSTARAWDQRSCERIIGTRATLTVENGLVLITDRAGTRPVAAPPELILTPVFQDSAHLGITSRYQLGHVQNYDLASYIAQARSFADAILGHPAGPVLAADFHDGVAHMNLIEAVRESAETRRYVSVRTD